MLYTKNIKKFIKDTTGNILIIFAIAISSLLAAALFAADYSKIVTAEHELQATADNIALYLGTYSIKYDKSNLQKVGEDRLNMLIKNRKTTGNPYLSDIKKITIDVDAEEDINVRLDAEVKIYFNILDKNKDDKTEIFSMSKVGSPSNPIMEIILVLDFSDSMNAIAINGSTRMQNLQVAVNNFLNTLEQSKAGQSNLVRIGIVPFSGAVNIKTPIADFNGNSLDFSIANTSDMIENLDAYAQPPSSTNAAGWDALKNEFASYFTGASWQYIDVRGDATYANRWINPALYHGALATDADDNSFTAYESGEIMGNGYSNNDRVYYLTNDDGSYYTLTNTADPAPVGSVPYKYTDSIRPVSCIYPSGSSPFAPEAVSSSIIMTAIDLDSDPTNNCKSVPVWNNNLWLYNLMNTQWNGCVEARPYEKDLDLKIDLNSSDVDFKFVPIAPSYANFNQTSPVKWFSDSTVANNRFWINEYGAYSDESVAQRVTLPYHNENYGIFRLDTGSKPELNPYYYYHAIANIYPNQYTQRGCVNPILPLQDNLQIARNYMSGSLGGIGELRTNQGTVTSQGLYWGWNLLTSNDLFPAAETASDNVQKIIILISDGLVMGGRLPQAYGNGEYESQFTPLGSDPYTLTKTQQILDLSDRYKQTCDKIKEGGIEIFAISIDNLENENERYCVTKQSYFYEITSPELKDKLEVISKTLQKIVIKK